MRLSIRQVRYYGRTLAAIRHAGRHRYGRPWLSMAVRAAALRRRGEFPLIDSLRYGLLDPAVSIDPRWVSKAKVARVQARINPRHMDDVVEDKARLASLLDAHGIPAPATLAILARDGHDSDGYRAPVAREAEWHHAIEALPDEWVLKPFRGCHGGGVRTFRRDGDGWRDLSGAWCDSRALGEQLAADECPCWVVQERMHNAPGIALGDGGVLNTIRVVLFTGHDNQPEIAWTGFRIAAPGSIVDNFAAGGGNLGCTIDPLTGAITAAVTAHPSGVGLQHATTDTATGQALSDYRVPDWDEVRALACRTATALLPVRTVGLDICITPQGAHVIEANTWWDPPPMEPLRPLVDRMWAFLDSAPQSSTPQTATPPAVASR